MGTLVYGAGDEYEIDDRVLSHVKVAIAAVLPERSAFLLNWSLEPAVGSGRVSIMISANVPLQFLFHGARAPRLSPEWVRAMIESASGQRGMIIIAEDDVQDFLATVGSDRRDPVPYQGGPHTVRGR